MSDKHISAEALTLSLRDDPNLNAASFARVKRHIEAAPDMVKRGEWISLDECANAGVYCSVCNKKVYKECYANVKEKGNAYDT